MIFALATETKLVTARDMYEMIAPLRVHLGHVAQAFMVSNEISVILVDRERRAPDGATTVVFVERGTDPNTIAHHYFDRSRQAPAARVFVENTTGLNAGSASGFESLCHEANEARLNGELAVWLPHPVRPGVEVAHEISDPTQDTYVIQHRGTRWQAANFVTPHWWRKDLVNAPAQVDWLEKRYGYGLDWARRMKSPGEISPEGYAVMRRRLADGSFERWSEDSSGRLDLASRKLANKKDSLSRTRRLLDGP
jgi:hypothetical protein